MLSLIEKLLFHGKLRIKCPHELHDALELKLELLPVQPVQRHLRGLIQFIIEAIFALPAFCDHANEVRQLVIDRLDLVPIDIEITSCLVIIVSIIFSFPTLMHVSHSMLQSIVLVVIIVIVGKLVEHGYLTV